MHKKELCIYPWYNLFTGKRNIIETGTNIKTSKTSATDQAEMCSIQKEIEDLKKFLKESSFWLPFP